MRPYMWGEMADCNTGGQVVFKYFVCLVTSASSLIERSLVQNLTAVSVRMYYISELVPYIDALCHKTL